MELEATWGRTVKVWWAYLWRNLVAVLVTAIACGLIGFVIGFAGAMLGADESFMKIFAGVIGFVIGLSISTVPIKMILNKNFGEFRLALIPVDQSIRPD